ncbi:MAG: diacylglycerol kinase family lipid kinase [Eubacteriales bacterium]|nr:diacylglycerol kinase family lipid kinase [Eubacteriales bacterium]
MLTEQKQQLMLVINPTAGKNRARDNLFMLINYFFTHDYHVTVFPTQAKGDACNFVAEYATAFDALVCVGGDGTLNEVVTGLMLCEPRKRPRLGYIPGGSTNDFANTLGISSEMEKAAAEFCEGKPFCCDIGRFNGRYFTYVAAFGLFTEVSYETPQPLKNTLGHAAYILEGAKSLTSFKSYHLKIVCDGEETEGNFIYGQCSNSTSIGGILNIGRTGVQLDDGLFEVILIRMPENLLVLNEIIGSLMTQNLENSKRIFFRRAKDVTFISEDPLPWTLDGESGGSFCYSHAEIIPSAVTFNLAPQERPAKALPEQNQPSPEEPEKTE